MDELLGKTVSGIVRGQESVRILFTDGTELVIWHPSVELRKP